MTFPVYQYNDDDSPAGNLIKWKYVCLQPCEKADDADEPDEGIGHEGICNWGTMCTEELFGHLRTCHMAPMLRDEIDYCCGQLITSRLEGMLHFINHALVFANEAPHVNDGYCEEISKYVCMKLEVEKKTLSALADKDLPLMIKKDLNSSAKEVNMDQSFRMPPYVFKSKTKYLTDWMYTCNQPDCGWGSNNLESFLDIHLNEDHDFKCQFRYGVDYCCGHMIPSKLYGIYNYINHGLRYYREAPRINSGNGDDFYKLACLRLLVEKKALNEILIKNLPLKKRKCDGTNDEVFSVKTAKLE